MKGNKTYDFNPAGKSNTTIFCKVSIIGPDGNVWGTPQEKSVTITVLPAPAVKINSFTTSAPSTYNGGPHITVTLNCTTNAAAVNGYTEKIEWKEGAAGNYSKGNSTYDFNPAGKSNTTIYCKVSIIGPDGNVWGDYQERDVTIIVLPAPSIKINSLTPSAQATYDGGSHVTVTLDCTTNAAAVDGYTEKIEWKEGAAGSYSKGNKTYDFNPDGKSGSTTTIYCKVSIIGPDGTVWGAPQEKSVTITVYSAPSTIVSMNLSSISEDNYFLEICEDDAENQKITLLLTGGDPQKWDVTISPQNNDPKGTLSQNGYEFNYTLKGNDLKAATNNFKTYLYNIKIQYIDSDIEIPDKSVEIKVWPKPKITPSLALEKDGTTINYNGSLSQNKLVYSVSCYEGDELVLSVDPSNTGSMEKYWEYRMGSGKRMPLPNDKIIPVSQEQGGSEPVIIHFYNKLKSNEVLSVEMNINRFSIPTLPSITLPNVDNTTSNNWINAEDISSPVDLYGGGTQTASFNFSPKTGDKENINGWTYSCNKGNIERTGAKAKWDYNVITSTNSANEVQTITIEIKNSIPANGNQSAENIGFLETKKYHIRAWRRVVPPSDYTLTDENNPKNNVKSTHGIREGNTLAAHVNSLDGGYNPGGSGSYYEYIWEGQGAVNSTDWTKTSITNSDNRNVPGRSKTTYRLTVQNKGPRGTNWVVKSFNDCDVYVYNRPETPTRLSIKGNGTSGTMIIEYNNISDDALLASGDYVIDFCYTDASGEHKIIAKSQTERGDIRWATGYSNSQMNNAFVYAHWLDVDNRVLITSGKRTLNGVDDNWDNSMYNLTPDQISEIKAMTRADDENYTAIHSISPDELVRSDIRIYNMNGMMVSTSTDGLKPGIYIIRFMQDGIMRSRKLSVKYP